MHASAPGPDLLVGTLLQSKVLCQVHPTRHREPPRTRRTVHLLFLCPVWHIKRKAVFRERSHKLVHDIV